MNCTNTFKIDLRQMLIALETAVDLVGMNDKNHGKRVGYIATQLANHLKKDKNTIEFAFELGLIHDCGVSTEQMHNNLVQYFDWADSKIHCKIGYFLLKKFEPFEKFAIPILHHHTKWETLQTLDLSEEEKFMSNLIFISDRIDILASSHYEKDILLFRKEIAQTIKNYSGTYFDPVLVEAFLEIEKTEAFWISLESRHVTRYTWDMGRVEKNELLNMEQLKELALIMGYIVDQKSTFTANHSMLVGLIAKELAVLSNLDEIVCHKLEIAGYLHDIGKLMTPDNILQKPGPLNELERSIMNQHSYETYEILRHIKGLEDIAIWASYHHEGLNGTGYPFHPHQQKLSIECRIISVADIFQALVQDRPYREGCTLEKTIEILDQNVKKGILDKNIVNLIKNNADKFFKIGKSNLKKQKELELCVY